MTKFKIEKRVKMPPDGRGRTFKYPWLTMSIDDSFVVPLRQRAAVRSGMTYAGKKYKRRFASRQQGNVMRVWRVK